jgi:hypothetical protein
MKFSYPQDITVPELRGVVLTGSLVHVSVPSAQGENAHRRCIHSWKSWIYLYHPF